MLHLRDVAPDGFQTVLADPPWRFHDRRMAAAPETELPGRGHYRTMSTAEIAALPVGDLMAMNAHCYLWSTVAMLPDGLDVLAAWGFRYVTAAVWVKVTAAGAPDGRGLGHYHRNAAEAMLFGVRGRLSTAVQQPNVLLERKRGHSRKPESAFKLIERASPAPRLELFARRRRRGWPAWGDGLDVRTRPAPPSYRGGPHEGWTPLGLPVLAPHERLTNGQRVKAAEALATRYAAGASLRDLAGETGWQATRVRRLLLEAGVELRSSR